MRTQETWKYIHSERAAMADTWADLTAEQWGTASWCDGWTVRDTAGHILAAAEQTPMNFYKELTAAGFRFNVFTARGVERFGTLSADELIRRLRARTSTTNHPPAPVVAMLGEIVVHGGDIRGPLGLTHDCLRGGARRGGRQLQAVEPPHRFQAADRRPASASDRQRLGLG